MKASVTKRLFEPLSNLKIRVENSLPTAIVKLFTTDSDRSYRGYFWLLIGSIAALAIALANVGLPIVNAMPMDIAIVLDSGWRILNGQIPNLDYYSPLGPLTSLLVAFGMKVASPSASSIAYANILLLVTLTPWAWFVARSRLSAVNAFLFALFMGILLITPRPLGELIRNTSYAMIYNRHAFVLLSLLSIELFVSPRVPKRPNFFLLSGLSSGILLALLFFSKINYFAIGVVAILLAIALFRFSKIWLIGLASGLAIVWISMHIFFDFNSFAYLSDISLAASSQNKTQRLHNLKGAAIANFYWLYLIFVLIVINSINQTPKIRKTDVFLKQTKVQISAVFVAVSAILICGSNSQDTDIPLFFISGLILLEYLRREFKLDNNSTNSILGLKYFLSILVVISLCGGILFQDLASVASAVTSNKSKLAAIPESQRLQSKTLSDMLVVGGSTEYPQAGEYSQATNDGMALLRPHLSSDSRVFSLDFANPFSFALELPPPKGDALWWHSNYTFNKQVFLDPERVFADVTLVIIPKTGSEGTSASKAMQEIYGDYLSKHFIKKDESQFWTLLVKP